MDRQQADAQAHSIMASGTERQKEVKTGLAVAERVNRLSAVAAVIGFFLGGVAGHIGGFATARSALAGGLAAYSVCRVLFWVLGRRAVSGGRS